MLALRRRTLKGPGFGLWLYVSVSPMALGLMAGEGGAGAPEAQQLPHPCVAAGATTKAACDALLAKEKEPPKTAGAPGEKPQKGDARPDKASETKAAPPAPNAQKAPAADPAAAKAPAGQPGAADKAAVQTAPAAKPAAPAAKTTTGPAA